MSRRRWIYINGEAVEITDDYVPPARNVHTSDGLLWNDRMYDGMRATDGTPINSRSKHREYMRLNNLTTMDDFTQTWQREEKKRDAYRTEGKGGAVKREHIERVIHDLQTRRK